jgi:hypothetical protein
MCRHSPAVKHGHVEQCDVTSCARSVCLAQVPGEHKQNAAVEVLETRATVAIPRTIQTARLSLSLTN